MADVKMKDQGEVEHQEQQVDIHLHHSSKEKTAEERRIVWKLDLIILPLSVLLYLCASLDRGNIGNAKLQGLLDILGDTDAQRDHNYSVCVMAFYITYIVSNVPANLIMSVLPPDKVIAVGALCWGVASTAQAGAHSFGSIVVCRLFIGIGEAGFGSAVALYYSFWYNRDEIASRLSIYIGAGSLAGAFGGLIAYGISFIDSHIDTWRILFLVDGLPTVALSFLIFFLLPSTPHHSTYINEREREVIQNRLSEAGYARARHFDKSAIKRSLTCQTFYLNGIIYLAVNMTLGSVSGFLPTIIRSFGYEGARAQLFTVPPYAVAFVFTMVICFVSDRYQSRGYCVAFMCLLAIIGFAILIGVPYNNAVRYFATFPAVLGCFAIGPLMLSWAANTAGSHSAAAVRLGFMNAFGQTFSILAAFSWPADEGPRWYRGFGLNLAINAIGLITALYLTWYYRRENAKRDAAAAARAEVANATDTSGEVEKPGQANVSSQEVEGLHDLDPNFRYYV